MTMPDAIAAIILLMDADNLSLTQRVYNIRAFAPTVDEFVIKIKKFYTAFEVKYQVNASKQHRINSWPEDVDDEKAKNDWNWSPQHDLERAFSHYLIKSIAKKYSNVS